MILNVKFYANFTQVICKHLPWKRIENNILNCSINYGPFSDISQTFVVTAISQSDTLILDLSSYAPLPNVQYYYTVSATYGTSNTIVEGTFTLHEGNNMSHSQYREYTKIISVHISAIASNIMQQASGLVFGATVGVMGAVIIILAIISVFISITAFVCGTRKASNLSTTENTMQLSHINTEMNVAYETVFQATHSHIS